MIFLKILALPTPSPKISPYFLFCIWNINTLSKEESSRVSLLTAHNSIHNYDISDRNVCVEVLKISSQATTIMDVTVLVVRKGWCDHLMNV